jgi:hypothetical protein
MSGTLFDISISQLLALGRYSQYAEQAKLDIFLG